MTPDHPTTLLAELTHRCPLHCPYCSNPLDLIRAEGELRTEDWKRVFTEFSGIPSTSAISPNARSPA